MSRRPTRTSTTPTSRRLEPAAGRVEFDSRGNSVWRWARDVIESTSVLLKRLENKDLALEPTQKVPVMRGADGASEGLEAESCGRKPADRQVAAVRHPAARPAERKDTSGGFDPYNSR